MSEPFVGVGHHFSAASSARWPRFILESTADATLYLAILALTSVLHRVPAQPPFDLLVHLLRFIMALHAGRFAFSWWVYWRWWRFIEEAEGDAGGGLANATVAALASAGHDYALWAASREAI